LVWSLSQRRWVAAAFVQVSELVLVGTSIGSWVGGFFGSFVAALISIPAAGALQILVRELWQATAPKGHHRTASRHCRRDKY